MIHVVALLEIFAKRHGHGNAAGDLGQEVVLVIDQLAGQAPPDVGINLVGEKDAGRGVFPIHGGRHARGIGQFGRGGETRQFFSDVGDPGDVVGLGGQTGRPA